MATADKLSVANEQLLAAISAITDQPELLASTAKAIHVRVFAPAISSYTSAQTANGNAGAIQYLPMATGAKQITLTNGDLTAGDNLLFAFGVDDADAAANFAAGAAAVLAGGVRTVGIPTAAQVGGKMAFRSESANTVAFRVTQES